MTETTAATKAKTTKHTDTSFEIPDYRLPKFQMPKFDLQNMEMPGAFREMAAKGVEQTRDAYAKAQMASEEAADLLETSTRPPPSVPRTTTVSLSRLPVPTSRAAFDYVHELSGVKSPSEFIELSTAQMRKQFEIMSAQNKRALRACSGDGN